MIFNKKVKIKVKKLVFFTTTFLLISILLHKFNFINKFIYKNNDIDNCEKDIEENIKQGEMIVNGATLKGVNKDGYPFLIHANNIKLNNIYGLIEQLNSSIILSSKLAINFIANIAKVNQEQNIIDLDQGFIGDIFFTNLENIFKINTQIDSQYFNYITTNTDIKKYQIESIKSKIFSNEAKIIVTEGINLSSVDFTISAENLEIDALQKVAIFENNVVFQSNRKVS